MDTMDNTKQTEGNAFKKRKRNDNIRTKTEANKEDVEEHSVDKVELVETKKFNKKLHYTTSLTGEVEHGESDEEFDNKNKYDSSRDGQNIKVEIGIHENRPEDFKRNIDIYEEELKSSKERDALGKEVYKGQKAYHQYINKSEDQVRRGKYTGTQGPIKAPTNLSYTTFVDYHPELCKDFKETGYCGYGDSCKFIHDRSDYKSGWELDKEWNDKMKKKQDAARKGEQYYSSDDENAYLIHSDSDEELPFACFICRNEYTNPVQTICGHYFCEKCALDRARKNKSCACCGKFTGGTFNRADNLTKKLSEKAKRIEDKQLHDDM